MTNKGSMKKVERTRTRVEQSLLRCLPSSTINSIAAFRLFRKLFVRYFGAGELENKKPKATVANRWDRLLLLVKGSIQQPLGAYPTSSNGSSKTGHTPNGSSKGGNPHPDCGREILMLI